MKDILASIRLIKSFVSGMSFEQYRQDAKTAAAVERHLQIVTEAAYRLGDEAETICPGPDWTGYRGMGNLLRHAYHRIQDEIVWDTVQMDLPRLEAEVDAALERLLRDCE